MIFRVYICLQNGTTPETPDGKPSLDEPTFTDLEPRTAGTLVMDIFGNICIVLNQQT